jgi:hypothetical protein
VLAQGVCLEVVSEILGHAGIAITKDVYGTWWKATSAKLRFRGKRAARRQWLPEWFPERASGSNQSGGGGRDLRDGPGASAVGSTPAGVRARPQRLLAGRQHPVGIQFAGRRVTVRIDRGVLQLAADGVLLRSLPNPLTPTEIARIRDAGPAGPPPARAAELIRVQRRVSSRGALVVAGRRIHVGMLHAGRTLDVEPADRTIRVYDDVGALVAEVPCTTTKSIARFKVRKPEPPRNIQPDVPQFVARCVPWRRSRN